jgi:hypothetical protein
MARLFFFEQNNDKPANSNVYAHKNADKIITKVHLYLHDSLNVGKTRSFNERLIKFIR